ncbi:GH1 family beta-glucosidase [Actinokineospora sp. NBRC 105648]|uniref:GH1 family beta-glucosidase n=1 Tax=Actinokineospora sp. NBRC 105648 TaxID=3032206 RepID=UPI0024A1F8AB|nr:GH1 family beta-glucosidase [Actinokineospora sp. NBRC 105648]GLZ39066.1 beta-glucosidase [Actinokineospora sp. NBRC 105648]
MSALPTTRHDTIRFPPGFLWGAATAAFQVEGATTAGGRQPSIWDTFCAEPGRVVGGHTGDPGADHYHRMPADVALMSELGLGAYRFSVSWPRTLARDGLDFYDRLVDALLANDIVPCATLYHWDLPQALEDRGGWAERDTAFRFADYAESVVHRLGDRVPLWTTLNEPWCSAFLGYAAGVHAPGRRDPAAAVAAVHHLMLGHGLALRVIRAGAPVAHAGITLNLFPVLGDPDAARRIDGLQNRLFLDPVLRGDYPADVIEDLLPLALPIRPGDLEVISAPVDLLGVNFYRDHHVSSTWDGLPHPEWPGSEHIGHPPRGLPVTDLGWEVRAEGLTELLLRLHTDYPGVPLYINENGACYTDSPTDGMVNDLARRMYLEDHVRAAHTALSAGVDLRGYFAWSLLDNFEWAEGYTRRFGIVHVDFTTQRRIVKRSGHWYGRVARNNGIFP